MAQSSKQLLGYTSGYISPEIFRAKNTGLSTKYPFLSEVYSFACTLAYICAYKNN